MYDRKREANEFVGDSLDEATASAARFYATKAEDLTVVEPEMGEIAGAAGRTVIVAFPKGMKRSEDRGDSSDRGERGRGRREREPRGGRGGSGERGRGREKPTREDDGPRDVVTPPRGESKGTVKGSVGEIGDFLLGVMERMKLGSFDIAESKEEGLLVYRLSGEAALGLTARDGRAAEALQLLANQVAKNVFEEPERIVIDIEGGSENREDTLEKFASRAADRALDSGRAIALDPMNSSDRRIIHITLRDRDKIATMSIGSGNYRQVVVVPEGAPEWDEASEAADKANG